MYIPPHFRNDDHHEQLAFMKAYPFAVFTCNGETLPLVTHLPFVLREENAKLMLLSHLSAGNPHAHALQDGTDVLVVFSGPNAYVSPSLYEKQENVPTWNYIAVHASGKIRLLPSAEEKESLLRETIGSFEPEFMAQWETLRPEYVSVMLNGIVAFAVEVLKLEGKFKLSQNKTAAERERIAGALEGTGLSSWMKK